MAAADRFWVDVEGRGGHAALPHLTVDPVIAAAHAVLALQPLVSRETSPTDSAVVTVARFNTGASAAHRTRSNPTGRLGSLADRRRKRAAASRAALTRVHAWCVMLHEALCWLGEEGMLRSRHGCTTLGCLARRRGRHEHHRGHGGPGWYASRADQPALCAHARARHGGELCFGAVFPAGAHYPVGLC